MSGPTAESGMHPEARAGRDGFGQPTAQPGTATAVPGPDPAPPNGQPGVRPVYITLGDGATHVATAGPGRQTIIGADPRLTDDQFARMCADVQASLPADVRPYVTVVVATNLRTLA